MYHGGRSGDELYKDYTNKKRTAKQIVEEMLGVQQSSADPSGSYTGAPLDGSTPTQDADDL